MPSIEDGGVEKNFFNIANFFIKKNIKVIVITAINNSRNRLNRKIKVRSLSENNKLKRRIKYLLAILLLIRELIFTNKNSIVISFQANIYCILICKIFNTKVITRSNASIFGWSKNFRLKLYKFFYSLSDCLIVNSNALRIEFKKILNLKSNLIYNPLDKKRVLTLSKKKIKFKFFKKNTINLINIGRLVEQKDHLTLLKAIKIVKLSLPIKLIIIGKGPLKKELITYIKNNNLLKEVKILNFTSNPFKYFRNTHFFILSSIFEGLPNVLLESILLKKFIISSNCPTGPKEILESGKYGALFKPGDYKQLAKLILNYSKNKKEYQKKIIKGYNSLYRFDYYNNMHRYLNLVNKL